MPSKLSKKVWLLTLWDTLTLRLWLNRAFLSKQFPEDWDTQTVRSLKIFIFMSQKNSKNVITSSLKISEFYKILGAFWGQTVLQSFTAHAPETSLNWHFVKAINTLSHQKSPIFCIVKEQVDIYLFFFCSIMQDMMNEQGFIALHLSCGNNF